MNRRGFFGALASLAACLLFKTPTAQATVQRLIPYNDDTLILGSDNKIWLIYLPRDPQILHMSKQHDPFDWDYA